MPITNVQVESVAKSLGLVGPFPQSQYVAYMERAFGRDGARFLDAVDAWAAAGAPPELAQRLYQMLARRPAMAAYVSRHQYSTLYAKAAELLFETGSLTGRTVIDYGCGFGLLTQLLARLHPELQFAGIDRAPIVAAARKLAQSAKAENLRFESDASAISALARPRLVLMFCVTHEMFPGVTSGQEPSGAVVEAGACLADIVGSDGLLLTINRFPYPQQQLPRLDSVMEHLGLHVTASDLPAALCVEEGGHHSELPIRVYTTKPATEAAVKFS